MTVMNKHERHQESLPGFWSGATGWIGVLLSDHRRCKEELVGEECNEIDDEFSFEHVKFEVCMVFPSGHLNRCLLWQS